MLKNLFKRFKKEVIPTVSTEGMDGVIEYSKAVKETNSIPIKSCPFCGSVDIIYNDRHLALICRKCFAAGPNVGIYKFNYIAEEEHIRALCAEWNKRYERHEIHT